MPLALLGLRAVLLRREDEVSIRRQMTKTEAVVTSIKRTYVTVFLVTLAFTYFAGKTVENNRNQEYLASIEPMLALRAVLLDPNEAPAAATFADLPNFSITAATEFYGLNDKAGEHLTDGNENAYRAAIAARDSAYPSKPINAAKLYQARAVRYSPRKSCDILFWSGDPGFTFQFLTTVLFSSVANVASSQVSFAQFELGCEGRPDAERFTALVFRAEEGRLIIGIPTSFVRNYFTPRSISHPNSATFRRPMSTAFFPPTYENMSTAQPATGRLICERFEIGILNILGVLNHRNYAITEFDAAVEKCMTPRILVPTFSE